MRVSREKTKLENIIGGMLTCIRALDKLTWVSYDKPQSRQGDLIEDVQWLRDLCDQYETELNYQCKTCKKILTA